MYLDTNFKTKKAAKEAVATGKTVTPFPQGLEQWPADGDVAVCGPWYPQPHKWYGIATVKGGVVVKIK